jgi:hypothetical protein
LIVGALAPGALIPIIPETGIYGINKSALVSIK